ncbi:MAG: hypothetical protein H0T73_10960 [Ardenticatenales bacterium]|nr:hypothetical protein [Ardenticatenales bacterium]
MLRVKQEGSRLAIRQLPIELYALTVLFSLPLFTFSLSNLLNQTEADGTYCLLVFALVFSWVMLDFIALREEIVVDRAEKTLTRTVQGLVRSKQQVLSLDGVSSLILERTPDGHGTQYRYLYLRIGEESHLINNPNLLHNKHQRVGELLGEFLTIPLNFSTAVK